MCLGYIGWYINGIIGFIEIKEDIIDISRKVGCLVVCYIYVLKIYVDVEVVDCRVLCGCVGCIL